MTNRTPDQIRRETVPNKHYALSFGVLGGLVGAVLCFGGWALFHQEQVKRYPDYAAYALSSEAPKLTLFPTKHKPGLSDDELRYSLLRFGNESHRYDAEIVRRGWYPKGENGKAWVFYNGAVKPVYADGALLVFKWPLALTMFAFLACLIGGGVADMKYRSRVLAGIPFDGSIVATVDEYAKEVKGNGMKYAVNPWKDR